MAMLKHHGESDVAFLARLKQCMQQLFADFADQKASVHYFSDQWTLDSKLCKLQTVRCIAWLHKQHQLFLVYVSACVAHQGGSSTVHRNSLIGWVYSNAFCAVYAACSMQKVKRCIWGAKGERLQNSSSLPARHHWGV